jgi:PilZ domain/Gram-negative bacterial TonB protein C-terminal
MSNSTDRLVSHDSSGERRFYPRITPRRLIYIAFGAHNLGILLNLGENGLLVSTPVGLEPNSVYRLCIRLNDLPNVIDVHVRVIWTTESKKRAGIQLLDLSDHDREQIRKWEALENSLGIDAEPVAPQPSSKPQQEKPAPPPLAAEPPKIAAEPGKKPERPPSPVFAPPAGTGPAWAAPPAIASSDTLTQLGFPAPRNLAAPRRAKRKSATPALVAWGVLGATISLGAALFLDPGLSEKFLQPFGLRAMLPAASYLPTPPPDALAAPGPVSTSKTASRVTATRLTDSSFDTSLSRNGDAKSFTLNAYASRPSKPVAQSSETLTASNSGSPGADFTANESPAALATKSAPAPAENQLFAPVPAAVTSPRASIASAAPAPPVPPAKSAITGSIAGSSVQTNDFSAGTPSPSATHATPNNTRSTWPTSGAPSASGKSSFLHPFSSSAVVNMDPGAGTVTEITPPRSLTSSFVALPGERVLQAPAITMHIQRSVRVPGDHWLWRSHKKLALGELTSRVDPQIPRLPVASGTITVQAAIDKDGRVTDLKPLNGSSAFLPSVARAIRQWHYEPTYLDNKPVETQAQIELDFHPQATRASGP